MSLVFVVVVGQLEGTFEQLFLSIRLLKGLYIWKRMFKTYQRRLKLLLVDGKWNKSRPVMYFQVLVGVLLYVIVVVKFVEVRTYKSLAGITTY